MITTPSDKYRNFRPSASYESNQYLRLQHSTDHCAIYGQQHFYCVARLALLTRPGLEVSWRLPGPVWILVFLVFLLAARRALIPSRFMGKGRSAFFTRQSSKWCMLRAALMSLCHVIAQFLQRTTSWDSNIPSCFALFSRLYRSWACFT